METLIIERTVKSTEKLEISLPAYFSRGGGLFYAIISPFKMLTACAFKGMEAVEFQGTRIDSEAEPITEADFIAGYEKAQLAIADRFHASCPSIAADPVQAADAKVVALLDALTTINGIHGCEIAANALNQFFCDDILPPRIDMSAFKSAISDLNKANGITPQSVQSL
jgi:hypothetical protein